MTQDAAVAAPDVYKVIFENDRIRLLEVSMDSGASSAPHSHPDYLVYALTDGTVTLSDPSGQAAEVAIHAGDVMWRDAEEHSAVNTGNTKLSALFFELK